MKRRLILALLLCTGALAQVPQPQIKLTGNIGAGGQFPLFNGGSFAIPSDANYTVTFPNSTCISCTITSAVTLTATRNVVMPAGWFIVNVCNYTSGGQSIQIIGPTGTGATIANGACQWARWDGTNWVAGQVTPGAPVTSVTVGTGWPTWLSPSIPSSTGGVQLNVTVGPIPNGALQNFSTTVNGQPCALGGTCTISTGGTFGTPHIVTGSRALNSVFTNTTGRDIWVTGWATTSGSSTGSLIASDNGSFVWGHDFTATISGGKAGFGFPVSNGHTYELSSSGAITGIGVWVEYF